MGFWSKTEAWFCQVLTPKVSIVLNHGEQVAKERHPVLNDEDPFKGLTRLLIPKFNGDKRSFESWYAGFPEIVGKLTRVLLEEKLFRLYSCLEGEALSTIQNLGYSAAAYEVATARLV